jgi:mono/diheme cytochrome c family protein
MNRRRPPFWLAAFLSAFGLALAALDPGGAGAQLREPPAGWDMWEPGWWDMWDPDRTRRQSWEPDRIDRSLRWRQTRHWTFIQEGVPAAYRDAHNPLAATPVTIRDGGALYAERCASCHDPHGKGHGDEGLALYPSPALLAHLVRMPTGVDGYLLWAIADGGEPFATSMPAFKDMLTQEQIWQIITYMRVGFPAIGEAGQ